MNTWHAEYTLEASTTPDVLWHLFRDVGSWKTWNAGIEHVAQGGPFSAGTWLTMKPPGQDAMRSLLLEVKENESFVDETRLGELVVKVVHRLERVAKNRTLVRYAVDVAGPGADEIGPAIASDFPEVLAALVRQACGPDEARS